MKTKAGVILLLIGSAVFFPQPRLAGAILYEEMYLFGGSYARSGATPCGTLVQGANGGLYGTTLMGSTNLYPGYGIVFVAPTNETMIGVQPSLGVVHSFAPTDGGAPLAGLAYGADGNLYGTTSADAISNALFPSGMGSVFSLHNFAFTRLYRFGTLLSASGQPLDGAGPRAPLVSGLDGLLFGTAYNGGSNGYAGGGPGYGTIFSITTNGTFSVLHSFSGSEGANPTALALGGDANLYGVASHGGANSTAVDTSGDLGFGTIFKIIANGPLTMLYSFGTLTNANGNALDGSRPNSLVWGGDGAFYGTTSFGGANTTMADAQGNVGCGTVFQITPAGAFRSLYSFGAVTNAAGVALDGANPLGPLVRARDGNFYGVTGQGGSNNVGTIFRITTNGRLTSLFSFMPGNGSVFSAMTGRNPRAGLTLAADGFLYGTTSTGPATNVGGTLFRIVPAAPRIVGSTQAITRVAGATNSFDFTVDSFYATTCQWQLDGASLSDGGEITGVATADLTLTGVTPADTGTYTLVASNLIGTARSSAILVVVPALITAQPVGATVPAGATNTFVAGVSNILATSFQWQCNGVNLTDGGEVSGSSTRSLTVSGVAVADMGTYSIIISNAAGVIQSAGAPLVVEPFIVTTPPTNLTVMAGATASFGLAARSIGAINYQWRFDGLNLADGGAVSGSRTNQLIIANATPGNSGTYSLQVSNNLGSSNWTVVLSVIRQTAPGYGISVPHSFSLADAGGEPNALLLGRDNAFYGTTAIGGTNTAPFGGAGNGTLYRFTTDGTLTVLHTFSGGSDEADPSSALVQGSNAVLYGTTASSVNGQYGTVFEATTNGTVTTLVTFYWTNGAWPEAVTLGNDGNLYGTIGPNAGSIFRVNATTGQLTTMLSFGGTLLSDPNPGLAFGADGKFYGSTMASGGEIFRFDPAAGLTPLAAFTNTGTGSGFASVMVQTRDGTFYGTTGAGGAYGLGTVFKFTTDAELITLYSFGAVTNWDGSALDGAQPFAGLTLGPDGDLYGTTVSGGFQGNGTVYKITPNGLLTTLLWFDGSIMGSGPRTPVVPGPDGNFYGTTEGGGPGAFGTIYELVIAPSSPPRIQVVSTAGGMITLSWNATVGETYQVQYRTELTAANWVNLDGPIVATGPQLGVTDSVNYSQRYYRVVQVTSP